MSTNCLVTTLKGAVDNSNLDKLGVLKLRAKTVSSFSQNKSTLSLNVNGNVTVTIIGDGVLATSFASLPTSTQKSIELTTEVHPTIYLSNGDYDIEISNKYAIVSITTFDQTVLSIGSVDKLTSLVSLTSISSGYSEIEGDIHKIKHIVGNVGYNSLTGDITDFVSNDLKFRSNYCYGDFTNILRSATTGSELISLRQNGKVGEKSSIDASQAPSNIKLLSASGFHTELNASWKSERNNSYDIIAFEGSSRWNFGDYLDAMLINQALCSLASGATGVNATIDVYGNRTSSSDSAVATLKGKGVTVKINGETL